MKTEEEAVPTWFKSYMDRVLYSKNIILLRIFAYNSEITLIIINKLLTVESGPNCYKIVLNLLCSSKIKW